LILLSGLILLYSKVKAEAIDISAAGGWSETINASDLQAGAGSNLISTYESVTGATALTISNTTGNSDNWKVDVRRTDTTWYINFHLYVKRTSDGTGGGSISGGLSYIEITATDSQFFSGAGNRSGVNLQYELTGMSLSVPPNTYTTTVTYTVVDS
jgi:hypothetical protein